MAKKETRQMLVDAFFSIYREKPINRISIREVTEKAGFHRSTFYEYFKDIYDLLEQEEEEIYRLQKSMLLDPIGRGELSIRNSEFLKHLGKLFELKGDKIALLIGVNGDAAFRTKLQDRIKTAMTPELEKVMGVNTGYIAEFLSSGLLSTCEMSYRNKADIRDVMTIVYPVVSKILKSE